MAAATADLPELPLPEGITSFYVPTPELTYHVLSAGSPVNPLIMLQHGFPELAFSWRKIMLPLAAAGYYVVAYDQRGFGRTTGWDDSPYSSVNLYTFQISRIVADAVRLVTALGHTQVECLVGHDNGGVSAARCALIRGDIFKRVVLLATPFTIAPHHPRFEPSSQPTCLPRVKERAETISQGLATLKQPLKFYRYYFTNQSANYEMTYPTGPPLQEFLRGYFYLKSAGWRGNDSIGPLKSSEPSQLATMPCYYMMPIERGMRETIAHEMKKLNQDEVTQDLASWLPEPELAVYASEYGRIGFQGGLNWYRVAASSELTRELDGIAGMKIEVPCCYIVGDRDWARFQTPGAVDQMLDGVSCSRFRGMKVIENAGHWVMQEQGHAVTREILSFLENQRRTSRT